MLITDVNAGAGVSTGAGVGAGAGVSTATTAAGAGAAFLTGFLAVAFFLATVFAAAVRLFFLVAASAVLWNPLPLILWGLGATGWVTFASQGDRFIKQIEAEELCVQARVIALDELFVFEPPHTLDHRRCREPDLLSHPRERGFAVGLQQLEDAAVHLVQTSGVALGTHVCDLN